MFCGLRWQCSLGLTDSNRWFFLHQCLQHHFFSATEQHAYHTDVNYVITAESGVSLRNSQALHSQYKMTLGLSQAFPVFQYQLFSPKGILSYYVHWTPHWWAVAVLACLVPWNTPSGTRPPRPPHPAPPHTPQSHIQYIKDCTITYFTVIGTNQ